MIPKERPETGGKEGLINVRDRCSLITSDLAPFPVTIPPTPTFPPDHLSLEVRDEGEKSSPLEHVHVLTSLGEGGVQPPPPVPLPWLTIGHLADGDG